MGGEDRGRGSQGVSGRGGRTAECMRLVGRPRGAWMRDVGIEVAMWHILDDGHRRVDCDAEGRGMLRVAEKFKLQFGNISRKILLCFQGSLGLDPLK